MYIRYRVTLEVVVFSLLQVLCQTTSASVFRTPSQVEELQHENLRTNDIPGTTVVLGIVFFIAILLLYFYYKHKIGLQKKCNQKMECALTTCKEERDGYQRGYEILQDELGEYRDKMLGVNDKVLVLIQRNSELQEQLSILNSKEKERLKTTGKAVQETAEYSHIDDFRLLVAVKSGSKRELSPEDWERMFELVNYLFNDFINRLRDAYPVLTMHDLKICCLLKISMSHEDISRIFSTAPDSLTKAKGRMKKRLNLSISLNLDDFVVKF